MTLKTSRFRIAALAFFNVMAVIAVVRLMPGPIADQDAFAPLIQRAGGVHYEKLVIEGEHLEGGIFDPSLEYSPDGKTGWLTYTTITGHFKPVGPFASTHLARSNDHGATWTFVKALNTSADATITLEGKPLAGAWRYEVSALVCDSGDPDASRRWKLFVHRYFWNADRDRMPDVGWIVMQTAAEPDGQWSPETPLFGAGAFPREPFHQTRIDINSLDSSLRGVVAYSEPGVIARDGHLYLAMTALRPSGPDRIILLDSADHAQTWRLAGTLLTRDDAHLLGRRCFDAASLAVDGGKVFLLVTAMSRQQTTDGSAAFEITSMIDARIRRDAEGKPAIAAYFPIQASIRSGPGGGQCDYDAANTHGGLLISQLNFKAYPEVFQIYQSRRSIVPR